MNLHELATLKALQEGVRPEFVQSVIQQESRGNPNAVSPVGARGVMQIMPATARGLGVDPAQLFDPDVNVTAGVRYLRQMLDRFGGNEQLAAMAYNAGPGRVGGLIKRYGNSPSAIFAHLPAETRNYTLKVAGSIPGAERRLPVSIPVPPAVSPPVSVAAASPNPFLARLQQLQTFFPEPVAPVVPEDTGPLLASSSLFPTLSGETIGPSALSRQFLPQWSALFA